ncbi:hypothetical protein B0T25DRAFT_521178 [Lasiosphaeria hispida]|uniref:Transmembrane protein n=1 Tax=Lasiosphaeria hispida TaxID=260671 RepID=A0AAJ0MBG3_9PEZI|nr:hypothetical protein B0T25DRAFT_521178 [Lasiosphaeria hispida]
MPDLNPLYHHEQLRLLFQNKPQSWRHLLQLLAGFHFAILSGRIYYDLVSLDSRHRSLKALDVLVGLIAFATRIVWSALFRDPHKFMGYRRPGASYRRAVYLVSFATTVPTLLMHIAIVHLTAKTDRPTSVGMGQCILQLVLVVLCLGVFVWIVFRFLLRQNDIHFEPTAPLRLLSSRATTSGSSRPQGGLLSAVYEQQQACRPRLGAVSHSPESDAPEGDAASEANAPALLTANANLTPDLSFGNPPNGALHCPTVARFDYMCQNRVGHHSWMSDRMIPVFLGIYSTILVVLVYMLTQLNHFSRFPERNAKGGLYAPLGGYLFCAFAIKRNIRLSLFAKGHFPPPPPWVRIETLRSKKPLYKNTEDGTTTTVEPRIRVFSAGAHDYVAKFNTISATCNQYLGHLGRQWVPDARVKPALLMFAYIGVAFFLFAKGFLCVFNYPLMAEEYEKLPDTTVPDFQIHMAIMYMKLMLMYFYAPFAIVVLFYAVFSGLSLLVVWGIVIMENSPTERGRLDPGVQL